MSLWSILSLVVVLAVSAQCNPISFNTTAGQTNDRFDVLIETVEQMAKKINKIVDDVQRLSDAEELTEEHVGRTE